MSYIAGVKVTPIDLEKFMEKNSPKAYQISKEQEKYSAFSSSYSSFSSSPVTNRSISYSDNRLSQPYSTSFSNDFYNPSRPTYSTSTDYREIPGFPGASIYSSGGVKYSSNSDTAAGYDKKKVDYTSM